MDDSPPSFSFVHAADLHLDTPFHGVQVTAPHVAEALRDASLQAFETIIELAISQQVAFVLFAGDIYDGTERGIRAQLRFFDGLQRLSAAGIASFVVHGNHDPVESGWSAITTTWPEQVTIFSPNPGDAPAAVVNVDRDGQRLATVQGISYAQRETHENLSRNFARPTEPGIHIGLLHCNVEGSPSKYSNYSPCTLADLRATDLDYLALGHVHDRRILAIGTSTKEPWIVYPGNTQARSINETGAKGVYLVHVEAGVIEPPTFVACDSVRFYQQEIAIDACDSLADLMAVLRAAADELLHMSDGRSIIVRATLTGRSPLHAQLIKKDALDDLLEALREDAHSIEPFCWWERLVDLSTSPLDLDEIRQRGDFLSDLVQLSDAIVTDGELGAELLAELSDALPKTFRADFEQLLSNPATSDELFRSAQLRALDELVGDQ